MQDLTTPEARAKLPIRREPYWVVIERGCALGYRHGAGGGTWIARWRDITGRKQYRSLGEADGKSTQGLNYDDALDQAISVIVRQRDAELAALKAPASAGDAIDEAAVGAVVEATRSRRYQPPPVDLAALAKDLRSAKRLYGRRLRAWRVDKAVLDALDQLAAGSSPPARALAAVIADPSVRGLVCEAWQAVGASRNDSSLALLSGGEVWLRRLAADMETLELVVTLARRIAEKGPSEEREIAGTRIEYDLFARVLPQIFERHFGRRFGVGRDVHRGRLSGPGVRFVMAAADLIGIRPFKGLPYTAHVILDAREQLRNIRTQRTKHASSS